MLPRDPCVKNLFANVRLLQAVELLRRGLRAGERLGGCTVCHVSFRNWVWTPGVQVELGAIARVCNASKADGRWRQENPQTFAGQRAWLMPRKTEKTLLQRRRKTRPNTQGCSLTSTCLLQHVWVPTCTQKQRERWVHTHRFKKGRKKKRRKTRLIEEVRSLEWERHAL